MRGHFLLKILIVLGIGASSTFIFIFLSIHLSVSKGSGPSSNYIDKPCEKRSYGNSKIVCVCNSTYCDTISPIKKLNPGSYLAYTSSAAGLRFNKSTGFLTQTQHNKFLSIKIGQQKYQTIEGFGGALTDAVGINFKNLSTGAQKNLMRSYFGEDSIEYNLIRVPIGCSDFSTHAYTYDDANYEDPGLVNFKLAPEDYKYKIPIIQEAQRLTKNNLKLMAVAWTSPKWMKKLPLYMTMFGELKSTMYQIWADYYVKFFDAYEDHNITFWSVSTGNEPSIGYTLVRLPSLAFTARLLSKWISNHFGPTLKASKHSHLKIVTLDDVRIYIPWFIDALFENEITKDYIDGIALHWYADNFVPPSLLDETHKKYPEKFLMSTEACRGFVPYEKDVDLGSWRRGEHIAAGIIENFQHWSTAWIDWNMWLDETGGPSYVLNYSDSPIIVDTKTGEFYKQPMYYAMGHFSKFVPAGSIRIDISKGNKNIQTIAFSRPDGGTTVVIFNEDDKQFDVQIVDGVKGNILLNISSHSITSVVYW